MTRTFHLVALLLMLSGCTRISSSRYLMASPRPPYTGPVRLFMVGELPPPSFDGIGILQVQRYEDADPRPATRLMMANAAAVGCNAILNYQVSLGPHNLLHGHAMWTAVTGTCIRVRPAPGGPPGP